MKPALLCWFLLLTQGGHMTRVVVSNGVNESTGEARRFAKDGRQPSSFVAEGNGQLLSPAQRYGRQFHVTSDGKPAYKERYDLVGKFVKVGKQRYLAVASLDGHEFHITPDGKRAYYAEYSHVEDFEEVGGRWLATVTIGNGQTSLRWFLIDPAGKRIQ
jgi:hypothetical protein